MLTANPNTFANFPLDKAGHRRKDKGWLDEAVNSDSARIIPFRDKQPLLLLGADGKTNGEAGWLSAHAREPLGGPNAMMIFLGTDEAGAPHFALDAPGGREQADMLLEGMGQFADMRAAAGICRRATRRSSAPRRRCSNGTAATPIAAIAAIRRTSPKAAGSANAPRARASIFRASIRS